MFSVAADSCFGTAFRDLVTFAGRKLPERFVGSSATLEFGQRNRHSEFVPVDTLLATIAGHLAVFKQIP
jgi:hypothetical protein